MVKLERLELGKIVGSPGLHGTKVEILNVIPQGITKKGSFPFVYTGFLHSSPIESDFLLFIWNPDFELNHPEFYHGNKDWKELTDEEKRGISDRQFKNQQETSKLVSMLRTSSETNNPVTVQGVIIDLKKKELIKEEYALQITGLRLGSYTAGDFISDIDIPLAKDFVKRVY